MLSPIRKLGQRARLTCVLIAIGGLSACSEDPAATPGPAPHLVLGLAELLEGATVAPRPSADLPAGASVAHLAGGLAIVDLPLAMADATTVPSDGNHYTWQLPWPVRQDAAGDRTWPTIDLPGTDPLPVDVVPDRVLLRRAERPAPERTDAWIDGRTLHIFGKKGAPADLTLRAQAGMPLTHL
ncbi:MAG: hypothetical protein P1V81_12735, partial [Planctomycetota bacterium]|nr:hypothetical protein [Planctomycetota bacterium]